MRDVQLAYATRPAPRYTSYPTAPHFSDAIGAAEYSEWLAALPPQKPISLYLHVPFCRQICWYCGCNMKLVKREEPLAEYAAALKREIDMIAGLLPGRMKVSHLHFGGGTPTALKPDALTSIMERVRARFDFTPGAEIAIESDPRTLSDDMIVRIGELGFTRASFGVQEFDPSVQKAINRVQPVSMVAKAVKKLRRAGVRGINFDLIYGLPHQTLDMLRTTIAVTSAIGADRCALFSYAHVPWMAKRQRLIDAAALPDAKTRVEMAAAGAEAFAAQGYQAIGLDHYALPDDALAVAARSGALRRNFQGYTTDRAETMIGFGATSIGKTPFGYVQNQPEVGAWDRAVAEGVPAIAKGVALGGEDVLRRYVIEQLMCDGAVDLNAAAAMHSAPADWAMEEDPALRDMQADGVLNLDGGKLTLTETGKPLARVVASVFDAYFEGGGARHSVAV
ncbi:MAG: oxygen-independent coproporphyrinogen III oxidase [Pseudomonadota bacterium]